MSNGWSVNLTFKPSSYLLNVNNNKVSREGDFFSLKDTSSITGGMSVNFWIYVSKDWFDGGIIDNILLFVHSGKYFARIYTDEAGLIWLEVYTFKFLMMNGHFRKNSISVLLENFTNRWHNFCIVIPTNFYDNGDFGQVYYDGVLQHRNIATDGDIWSSIPGYLDGFCFGYNDDVHVDVDLGTGLVDQYCSGNFVGNLFDLFVATREMDQSEVDYVYNTGTPWSEWPYGTLKGSMVFWSRLQDRGSQNKKTSFLLDDFHGDYRLNYISNFKNRYNTKAKLPNFNLRTEAEIQLSKTRNDNKFKTQTIPNKDFQNLWIKNCAAEKTKYYDTQGMNTTYAAGLEIPPPTIDNSVKYLVGGDMFSKPTFGGFDDNVNIFFDDLSLGIDSKTAVITGKLYFLLKITGANFAIPDVLGKSTCFVVDFHLNHTEVAKRDAEYLDTFPNYLSGPLTVPPLAKDIDYVNIDLFVHTANASGDILQLKIILPNFSGLNETVDYEYSYLIVYSVCDTTDYIPLV